MNTKIFLATGALALLLAPAAMAYDGWSDRYDDRLDRRGDRIDDRLDRRGEWIDERLDRRGDRIDA